jgi:hypothetical protein
MDLNTIGIIVGNVVFVGFLGLLAVKLKKRRDKLGKKYDDADQW